MDLSRRTKLNEGVPEVPLQKPICPLLDHAGPRDVGHVNSEQAFHFQKLQAEGWCILYGTSRMPFPE
jgi:hypothetical protein